MKKTNTTIGTMTVILGLLSFCSGYAYAACDDGSLRDMALAKLSKMSGQELTYRNLPTGNGTTTLSGSSIRILRGYIVDDTGRITNALLSIAECNPETDEWVLLANSASSPNLP